MHNLRYSYVTNHNLDKALSYSINIEPDNSMNFYNMVMSGAPECASMQNHIMLHKTIKSIDQSISRDIFKLSIKDHAEKCF